MWTGHRRQGHFPAVLICLSPPPLCHFIPYNRFSEGMLITTLRLPAPSPLRLKPSMCAFTPKSVGGTAPCAWSCSAASCQVSEPDIVRTFAQNINKVLGTVSFLSIVAKQLCTKSQVVMLVLNLLSMCAFFLAVIDFVCWFLTFPGCSEPMGMKSGHIQDYQITASSIFRTVNMDMFTWEPGKARLDKQGKVNAWTAGHSDQSQWLQVRAGRS